MPQARTSCVVRGRGKHPPAGLDKHPRNVHFGTSVCATVPTLPKDKYVTHSPDVELRLPAESAYVAVLRMTTAGLAARLDFTLDDIEDLRMAVGEACALVLEHADPDGDLYANFDLSDGSIRVSVSADSRSAADADQDSFGWQVLTALTSDVVTERDGRLGWVSFTVRSSIAA
jgi:serine/threonine-protein kinase RsbW